MAEKSIFKYLTIILGLATAVILVKDVFLNPSLPEIPLAPIVASQINLDFDLLSGLSLENLTLVEKIALPEMVGRENPFDTY